MGGLLSGEALFHVGLVIMGGAALGAVVISVLIWLSGKKLKKELDAEFGEKLH